MKRYYGLIVSLFSLAASYGDPPTCTKTYEDLGSHLWKDPDNWPDGKPDNDDVACILDGQAVLVAYDQFNPAQAKALYVDSTSALVIWGGDTLVLCGGANCIPSQIDGELEIYYTNGYLKIGQNVTINGSGSIELSLEGSGAGVGTIAAVSGTPTLTLGSGMTVEGYGNFDVATVNNGNIEAEYGSLNFNSTLTLNGTLTVAPNGTAYLTQNLTVPSGAVIQLETSGGNISKLKPKTGYTPTLTVSSGGLIQGAGELHFSPSNNGTIAARDGTLDLKLGGSGSGKWTAETSTGRLLASAEVTGSGLWELDDNAGAKIEVDAASECLTGSVHVTLGTLDVDAKFHTTGQLSMGGPDSLIDVAATKWAKFSLQSPPSCSGGGGGGGD